MATIAEVLEVRRGTELREYPLNKQVMMIGRGAENDIVVIDEIASRHHAKIKWHQGSLCVVDLASTNGTMLNNRKLDSHIPYPIKEGDVITIGGFKLTLLIRKGVQYDQTQVAPPKPTWWQETVRSTSARVISILVVIALLVTLVATRVIPIDISLNWQPSTNATATMPTTATTPQPYMAVPTSPSAAAVAKVSPSVVKIEYSAGQTVYSGSGVVIDKAGYILTADHVVDNSHTMRISFTDNDNYECKVIARDTARDLAIIKIVSNNSDFPVAELGDSTKSAIGDEVLILGFPLSATVNASRSFNTSKGIISGFVDTDSVHYIKTDAAVNHGNSGGPMINMNGQVIGIMVQKKFTESNNVESTVVEGISAAVSINDARTLISETIGK